MLFQSVRASIPIFIHTVIITATEAAFTASRKAEKIFDFLSLGKRGLRRATKRKEGRKIPSVARREPVIPPICHPINVAVERTGPGVN